MLKLNSFGKVFPIFASTFTLSVGLNHVIFLCLTLFRGGSSFKYVKFSLYPLKDGTSLEKCAASSNAYDQILLILF